ncbi:hypothetical protein SAMN02745246_04113 [Leeuwenhoekiella marinoflava DSM 3653]|uniref:Uncharacterized protein n=2 Tax=Leeuwenhoekiella marinoflava TaxID=988 RepID=A0A4V1KQ97_9FLAO|nr:hypothetical protein DSL99_4103 [Leeuwenhoekiella marinoflava]SHG06976.1 hypothetical protein SAMN02745246_04113 [Leeuwenhoekiella marinoflava DSM 3653]
MVRPQDSMNDKTFDFEVSPPEYFNLDYRVKVLKLNGTFTLLSIG